MPPGVAPHRAVCRFSVGAGNVELYVIGCHDLIVIIPAGFIGTQEGLDARCLDGVNINYLGVKAVVLLNTQCAAIPVMVVEQKQAGRLPGDEILKRKGCSSRRWAQQTGIM